MRRQDSAHWAFMVRSAQEAERLRTRFGPETCPPADAYRGGARSGGATQPVAQRDSALGLIRVCRYGEVALTALMTNDKDIALIGDQHVLTQMDGLIVLVIGRRSMGGSRQWPRMEVRRAVMRMNTGDEVHDGTLRRERGGDFLELPDGRRLRIPKLPEDLAGANGMRIWIAGPLDDPVRVGVIRPRPKRSTRAPRR